MINKFLSLAAPTINISDVNGLEAVLDSTLTNPFSNSLQITNTTASSIQTLGGILIDKDISCNGNIQGDNGSGFVFYHSGEITPGNPVVVTVGTDAQLLNNGLGTLPSSNITQIPLSGHFFFDTTTSLITPEFEDDCYSVTIRIDAESSSITGSFELYLDVNGGAVIIPMTTQTFPKGANLIARFIATETIFAGADFKNFGAQVRLLSIVGTTTISDYRVNVARIHRSR